MTPRRARISSACGVVGPLAASATMRAFTASALWRVMTFSSAAGTRMSHFMVSRSSLVMRDDFCFLFGEESCRGRAGIAKSLNGNGRAAKRDLLELASLFNYVKQPARGGFAASLGTADGDGFAGNHTVRGMADGHSVGVHNPGHGLCTGVDIRCGNVHGRSNDRQNLAGVTACHALELALGHALGIADDAALGASKRHVDGGGLPSPPSRERLHFIERNVGVIADAPLARAARNVVLHTVAGKHLYLAVVHLGRQGNFQNALGRAQNLPQAGIELQEFGRHVELNLRDAEGIQVFTWSDAGHHGRRTNLSCRGCWLCDRGHRRRSFRLLDLSEKFCFHWAQVQNSFQRNSVYPFAANFLVLMAYASRQAGEQKWKSWPPSRNGMESVSSTRS